MQSLTQGGKIVRDDAEPPRLAAKLAHSVSQYLGVGVVDLCWLHRISRRNDLVASRENRDNRLSPYVDMVHSDRRKHSRIPAGQHAATAKYGFTCGDIGSGK